MDDLHINHEELEIFRSKLFMLDGDDGWLDRGAGYPLLLKVNDKDVLKFYKEDVEEAIFGVELSNDLIFDHQEDKIFTWFNEKTKIDMALSFQHEVGCETLWQKIQEILATQKKRISFENQISFEEETLSAGSESGILEEHSLTVPKEDKLNEFEAELKSSTTGPPVTKNIICRELCQNKVFLESLFRIFHKAEEAQDEAKLRTLFQIFRHLITLAHYDLYVILLNDEYHLDVFGILEYDPDNTKKSKISHREFFQEHGSFKPIANINDEEVLKIIHWNFRLLYLRDYILGHHLDEKVLQFISTIIQANYMDILKYIQLSKEVLSSLFDLLRSRNLNALKMIHEICVVMKNIQVDKDGIFKVFCFEYGLFEILEEIMLNPQPNVASNMNEEADKDSELIDSEKHQQIMLEIIMLSLTQTPVYLCAYCILQHQKMQQSHFYNYLVDKSTTHKNPTIQNMLAESIKHLLDAGEGEEENQLRSLFYEQSLQEIVKIFDNLSNEEYVESGQSVALDLLIYCTKKHGDEIRKRLIPLSIIEKIFKLFSKKNKFFKLMVIQFYKLLMRFNDSEILHHISKPLGYIINFFVKECKDRWNLLHSSILEIFHIILQEEILVLLKFIMKGSFKGFLEDPAFSDISSQLKEKYSKLTNTDFDLSLEERKQSEHSFTYNSRKPSANLYLELSPSRSNSFSENGIKKPTTSSPKHGEHSPKEQNIKRTSSSLAKVVDYDGEMEFNNETRGKDSGCMIEDIHVKKRKLDEINSIKLLNRTYSN